MKVDVKLYNDDCFNVLKNIPSKSIDLVVTDPPYLFSKTSTPQQYENTTSKFANSKMYSFDEDMMGKMSSFDEDDINKLLDEIKRVMKGMNAYFFCSEEQVRFYMNWACDNSCMSNLLVWEKPLKVIAKNRFDTNAEYCIRIYKRGKAHINKVEDNDLYSKVMHVKPVRQKEHPAQKPVKLMQNLIELSSHNGDIVLDPFMGMGTCGLACINSERNFIGIEMDADYFKYAEQSINEANNDMKLF